MSSFPFLADGDWENEFQPLDSVMVFSVFMCLSVIKYDAATVKRKAIGLS